MSHAAPGAVSIVQVSRNRLAHLLHTAPLIAGQPHHHEHLVVDWGSDIPIRREQLPADPRLRLLRVEAESVWNLGRAYNFAIRQARGPWILKLDADTWPDPDWTDGIAWDPEVLWSNGQGLEHSGSCGWFLVEQAAFLASGGFHECLERYGVDDKELTSRLRHLGGLNLRLWPSDRILTLEHGSLQRMGMAGKAPWWFPSWPALQAEALKRASILRNQLVVGLMPWGPWRQPSRYRSIEAAVPDVARFEVEPATVPRLSPPVAAIVEHHKRLAFWTRLLVLPPAVVERLPGRLLPADLRVRGWHRGWAALGHGLLGLLSRTPG